MAKDQPIFRVIRGDRAFYYSACYERAARSSYYGTIRRLTMKVGRNSTARTLRRNLSRMALAHEHGLVEFLQTPAALDKRRAAAAQPQPTFTR